jgi:hypothetical protein
VRHYRPRVEEVGSSGQDSFLDVVTNIVGILIILVMVIGAKVQHIVLKAAPTPDAATAELAREVVALEEQAAVAESEIAELDQQTQILTATVADAGQARLHLATMVSAARAELESRKQDLDTARVQAAEGAARRDRLRAEIEQCDLEAEGLAFAPQTTQELLAYPTPISRTVTGDEIHFRLSGGRIAYIPLTELFELAKAQTQRNSNALAAMQSRVETVGPAQDFMLDYVIEVQVDRSRAQVMVRSREWVVRPISPLVGESGEAALASHSRFRRVLSGVTPETTVTLWCYPDSFEEYRTIREELHRLGIPAACRPLPEGAPIGGSTEGSKSVVQ